jgi:hypothetical protein
MCKIINGVSREEAKETPQSSKNRLCGVSLRLINLVKGKGKWD